MNEDNNDNFRYNNSDNLEYNKFEAFNNKEDTLEDMYLSQRPSRPPGRPEIPGRPERPEGPGRPERPEGPGRPGRPDEPVYMPMRPPGRPSYRQPPRMAPPYPVPQLPRGMVVPSPGTSEFNVQYRDLSRFNNLDRNLRYCLNRFTFIWQWNGRTFWFYPIFINRWSVEGFIWNGNRWFYNNVNLNSIFFYQCF
jgi:hypothetical protein